MDLVAALAQVIGDREADEDLVLDYEDRLDGSAGSRLEVGRCIAHAELIATLFPGSIVML